MKKAFCEPQNINFCPPIAVASVFTMDNTTTNNKVSLKVQRSAENGGDREYSSKEELEKEFADGSLHPGDLKAAVTTVIIDVLTKISNELKNDTAASQAAKQLKAFEKKHKKK
jgi:tyrosyl-tRNA synthetase